MSLSAAVFLALAGSLLVSSLKRPAWAVALYMLTFFAAPHAWWWGKEIPDIRYAFIAGFALLVTVALHASSRPAESNHRVGGVHYAAIGMAINASLVHLALAVDPVSSYSSYVQLLKFLLLFVLISAAIRTKQDFRIAVMAIALGAGYVGYEVTINERGYFSGGRLEGVGPPGADSSNALASLMVVTLPLVGCLFVAGSRLQKLMVVATAPLVLNVVLLCNSRGGFLGLIGGGAVFLLVARGATRKKALQALCLGGVALFLLLGDARIIDRFTTTFVGSEDRDRSAASRIEFWRAGLLMLSDYPLGAGGGAFKNALGGQYLAQVSESDADRSLHNGYLTEATNWGVQGFLLHLLFVGSTLIAAYRASERCRVARRMEDALVGLCVIAAMGALLIHSVFGTFLGNEWGFWLPAFLLRYSELYGPAGTAARIADPGSPRRADVSETAA